MEELTAIIIEASHISAFQDELGNRTEVTYNTKPVSKYKPKKRRAGICQYCNKWFADAKNLYAHVRIHTGEKPFVCGVCHKGFNQSQNLRRHMVIHTVREPLKCDVCDKQFLDKHHFNQHVQVHTGVIGPFICKICNKEYAYEHSLKRHQLICGKNRENRFFCQICEEGFLYEYLLKNHMRIHDPKIKCYPCTLCRKVLLRRSNLKRHLFEVHNIKTALQCKICKERFTNEKDYEEHHFTHREEQQAMLPQQIEKFDIESDEDFDNSTVVKGALSEVRKDEKKIIFQCRECNECFLDQKALETHDACHRGNAETVAKKKKEYLFDIYKDIKIAFQCRKCEELFPSRKALGKHYLYHDKESSTSKLKKRSRTDSDKCIEQNDAKKFCSEILSTLQEDVEMEQEQDFEDDFTQDENPCEVSSDAPEEIEIEEEKYFENDMAQNEYPCEESSGLQEPKLEQCFDDPKNRYLCGICYEEFNSVTSIQEHMLIHKPQPVFVCDKCKTCFDSDSLLKQHACPIRTEVKIFDCYICEEKFSNTNDLKDHLINHTKTEPL